MMHEATVVMQTLCAPESHAYCSYNKYFFYVQFIFSLKNLCLDIALVSRDISYLYCALLYLRNEVQDGKQIFLLPCFGIGQNQNWLILSL